MNLGNRHTILVEPFHLEDKVSFKLKRKLENIVFKRNLQ